MAYMKIQPLHLLLLWLFLSGGLYGGEPITDHVELGMLLYFRTDQDAEPKDYYRAGGKVKLEGEIEKDWEFQVEIDIANDAVRLEELWGRRKGEDSSLQLGIFANSLLREDELNPRKRLFAAPGYVQARLDDMGWYPENALGLRYEGKPRGNRFGAAHGSELFFLADNSDLILSSGFSYPWAGKKSFLGFNLGYNPRIGYRLRGEERPASSYPEGWGEDHYLMGSLFFGDRAKKKRLIYKLELSAGHNRQSPAGYLHTPGGTESSWFGGGDLWMGYVVDWKKLEWTPGLNTSYFVHDLSESEAYTLTARLGNKLVWCKDFYLHLDTGIEINRLFRSKDGDLSLHTEPEALCAVRLQYQY